MKRLLLSFLLIIFFSSIKVSGQTTFDFETNVSGYNTKTVTQSANSYMLQITSADYPLSNSMDYLGIAISGNASLAPEYLNNSPRESSITISLQGGGAFNLNSFRCDDITGAASTMVLTSSKGTISFSIPGSTSNTLINVAGHVNSALFQNISSFTISESSGSGLVGNLDDFVLSNFSASSPAITSATYNANTGTLNVTGSNFQANGSGNDVDVSKLTVTGEGGSTYTLTSGGVEISSSTSFSVTLNATDKSAVNMRLNKNGTSSTGGTTYNLAAAADWMPVVSGAADLTGNAVTVSNVAVPAITSGTYDASTGSLTVTGTGFLSASGASNDIVSNKFTFTGEGGTTYTLTDSSNPEITSGTSFTITLSATDKAAVNQMINKNGTASTGGTTYNLAGAEDWAAGADAAVVVADVIGNGITVSNVAVPAITSATYDASTGTLTVTGTGFLSTGGPSNDIVSNKFTFTGEGGTTYTLTDSSNPEITSGTSFTITLSATDKASVNQIVNKNGTASTGGTTYNLAAAEDWAAGADAAVAVADVTGNGITASNVIPRLVAGLGTAINFERSRNEGMQVADHSSLNLGTGSFTIESWVKRSSGSGFFTILGKQTGAGSGVFLRFNDNKLSFAAGNYPASTDVSSVSSVSDNNWHHIAAVMDVSGKTMRIYIDGVLDASNSFTTNYTISSTAALGIGFKPNFGEYFDGSLDDVRFWSTARTASQIKEYMHTPLAGTESGLVAYWNFEEGSGTSIDDRSSNANTGTLQNSDSDEFVTGNSTYSENVNDSYISLRLGGSDLDDQASATAVITALPANGKIYQTNDGYAKGTQITAVSTQLTDNGGNPRRVIYEPNLSFTGSDSFSFKVNDGTNSSSNTQVVNLTVLADTQAPTVTSVNSSTANGSYKTGDAISIQVNFSEAVTITGMPQLTLETGTTDRVINYASGSGSSTLTFNYTIQAGDNSSDLDYNSTGSLALNGGTIKDASGNDGTLTLAAPGAANSLGANKSIVVDGIVPIVSSVSSSTNNAGYKAGNVISIQVNFSEAVTVTGTPQLTLETGTTDRVVNYWSGSGTSSLTFRYTIQSGDSSSDLDYTGTGALALNSGTIQDAVGNAATLTLPTPGAANSLGANKAIVIDAIVPTVSSVSSSTANGTYKAGDVVSIQVNISEAVTVTGTPQLTLETGLTDQVINYVGGSGTSVLTFNYTVQAGDSSADLDYTGTNALALNGGVIRDAVSNNATLTLPSPGEVNSLGNSKSIVIDGISPSVSSVGVPANATYITGQNLDLTVNFDENVTVNAGGGTPRIALTLSTGGTVYADYLSGSGSSALTFRYTVVSGNADTDGISVGALALNGGTIKDAAGNNSTLTLNSVGSTGSVLVDAIAPAVTSVGVPANATYIINNNLDFTVNFDENVTVNTSGGTPRIGLTLSTGGTVYADYLSGSGTSALVFRYTVVSGNSDSDGIAVGALSLNGGTMKDAAGNNATLTLNSVGSTVAVLVDAIVPGVSSMVITPSSIKVGQTSTLTITFSEAVTGFTNVDLTIASGSLTPVSSSDGGITWTATFTPTASVTDATNVITLDNTGIADAAGNAGTGTTNSNNYAIDTARPTATIVVADAALSAGETSTVTITFSEAVTGFANADLTIANGTLSAVSSGDGGITWTATFTPTASVTDATNVITLDITGVADAAGNAGTGTTNSNNYAIDTARPTATIVVVDAALSAGETSTVTITFSEAVTGFTNADLTIANGTLSAVSSGDGGITWTATFTPTASVTDATNVITLDNTGVADAAGNAGTGTTNSNNYAIDTARPTAIIVVADAALSAGETSTVTITFSEAVTGFTNADLTIANGTLSAVSSGDGGITWTATFTPTASVTDATNVITLNNTGVADAAGNAGSGTTNSNNYTIDTNRPTATIVVADAALSAGETSAVTITFSEAVTGFTNADLTIANGTLSAVSSGDGGITWTATFTPTASVTDATNVITLDNTGVADAAGNAGAGTTNSNNYAIDTARPTATIVVADAALSAGETSTVTITFSDAVTGFTNADLTLANGTLTPVSSGDGGITWTATFTPTASVTDATNVITLDNTGVADAAGNAGTGTTNSNNYAIDTSRPTAAIVVADAALSAGETSTVTITFSEAVTGFTNADLTLANGTLSAVSSTDGGVTWTATFTPTASVTDATNVITLDNTGVADASGNVGTGTTNSNNYAIDTSNPAVVSVSLPSDGAYVAGQHLDFTVNFDENTLVNTAGGTPRIELTLAAGGSVYADYLSGSGTSAITFRYTVVSGNSDNDGIAIGALSLNGGTIKDAAGNNVTLTLNNVSPGAGVLVDAILPVLNAVSIVSNNPVNSIAKTGDVITVSLTASEPIATPSVTIAGHAGTISGSGNSYTASFTMLATDTEGQVAFTINFSDLAGNAGSAVTTTSNSSIVTFDKTAPGTPVNLAATVDDTRITLNWTANSENDLAGYSIYGGTTANPITLISIVSKTVTNYTHTGLTNGTTYYYRISALDNAGNESAVTGDVTAVPRATQAITFNALTPKTYGDLDFDPGASASSGLTMSYISDNPAVATIVSGKVHITGAGTAVITAKQPGNPAFYAASDVSQILTVNKKDINVLLNATPEIIRTYNSSTMAALVPANYSLQGLETGDDVSINGTATFDNKNSGMNKTVTVNSFVLSGIHKDNYNLTTTTASTVGTITAKNISLTLNAAPAINKVYNGSSVATLVPDNYVLIGVEPGDVVGVTGSAVYSDKNVGSGKPVTVTSFAVTGADQANYTLTTTSASTTGSIIAKDLFLSLNASPLITKTYDGSAAANLLPGNYSLSGVETGDIVTVTGTAAYADKNAGTGKLISVNSFSLAGADKNNYTLTTASATTTGEIKAKEISLSLNASPVITKVYDATAAANLSAANYSLSGVESGDDVTVTGTALYSDKNAGNGKTVTVSGLNLSGAQSGNYNLTTSAATTTGNITVKDITLSINPIPAVSKVYDGTTVANLSSSNYVLTGVESGDMLSVTGTAAYSDKNAGSAKSVMVNSFLTSGADQGNYHLINTSVTTTGTILPMSLTVTAADKTKFQNTVNPDLTVTYSGFISGEGVSNLTTLPIATTPAVTLSDVGTYPIVPGGGMAQNYSFQYVPGTLTIVSGAPTSISLSTAIVYENTQAGTVTGSLSSASNVPGAVYTYTLVSGSGATDNGLFSIKDNQLITSSRLNYEEKATYSIRVRSTTQYNVSLEKEFLISIRDVNEPPVFAAIPNTAVCYTTASQKLTVNGISAGPETGQAVTMSVSSNNPDLFEQLSITNKGILSYRIKDGSNGEAKITISIKDDGGVLNGGNDTYSQSFDLKVNPLPDAGIVSNKPADTFKGEEITLTATGGSAYRWRSARGIISGQNSATLNIRPEETTTYRVEITTSEGCVSEREITITVKEDFIKLDANNIISPNGDGKNDNLIIKNLDMYPNNEVKIFDRAGRMVFSKVNYTDEWNGTFQGSPLAEDTYYYVVDFGSGKPKLRGYITIVRD